MNKTVIYWIIGILTAGPIFLILFQDRLIFSEDQINNLTKIIPAFFSAGALLVALSLYDKHGLKKIIFEKKLKAVLELAEAIKAFPIQVFALTEDMQESVVTTVYPSLEMKDHANIIIKPFFKLPILSSYHYFFIQLEQFRKFQNNPYLPLEISNSFKFLEINVTTTDLKSGFAEITAKKTQNKNYDLRVLTIDNLTLEEYLNGYQGTLKEIKKWLDKYANIDDPIRL